MNLSRILKEEKNNIISFLLGPVIAILLVCSVYSHVFVEDIPFGVVDNDNTSMSRNIVSQLKNHPGLNVNYYSQSEEELKNVIDDKKIVGGIIIPKDFSKDFSLKKSPNIMILIDGTNMLTGGNALSYSSAVLGTLNAGIQINMLQGRNLYPSVAKSAMGSFSYVERVLYDPQSSYIRNLTYTIIPVALQASFLNKFILPLLMLRKNEFLKIKFFSKEGKNLIIDTIIRIFLISTVSVVSTFIALCVIGKIFSLPLRGDILIYIVLMYSLLLNLTAMSLVITSFLKDIIHFVQFYLIFSSMIMMTSGIVYPEYMTPPIISKITKCIWPFIHVAIPLKYLNLKGIGWEIAYPYILDSFKYTLFWLPLGLGLYAISIIMKRKNDDENKILKTNNNFENVTE